MSDMRQEPIGPRAEGGVSATEALTGVSLPGSRDDGLSRARLTPMVAAALRTALDRLLGDLPARRPIVAGGDEDVLEVRLDAVDPAGLVPSGEVLESAGGSLSPAERLSGAWIVRVPLLVERPTYLMVEQGTLSLAVPWPAVARVRMLATDAIHAVARRHGWVVLPRFADAAREAAERPVVVLGRGLKRACLIADRLVWRLPAEPIDDTPPGAQLARSVRTAQGEVWRVVETEPLLRDVLPMPLPTAAVRSPSSAPPPAAPRGPAPWKAPISAIGLTRLGAAPTPASDDRAIEPAAIAPEQAPAAEIAPAPEMTAAAAEIASTVDIAPAPGTTPAPAPEPIRLEPPAPIQLGPEHVDPLEHDAAVSAGRALVAEDSIIARIFLERLLVQHGFEVVAVDSARGLRGALERSDWSVVFVDVELPDARGAEHLRDLARLRATVVALVRDAADEDAAASQGIVRTLRKPFDADALRRLLTPPAAAV